MRTSGPAKKPTALKERTGNPGKRALPKNEPKPDAASVACPAWLDGEASAKWKTLAPHLKKLGLLTALDLDQLAVYCRAYAEYRHAEAEIDKLHGKLIETTESGRSFRNPYLEISKNAWKQMLKIGAQFGFTPASRADIEVFGDPEMSDKMKELFG